MTTAIWEINEKTDYIVQRYRRLQDQWHIYCNSLVQGITLPKTRLHHAMSCAPDKELCLVLFEHFRVYVILVDGFNSRTIEYYVETKDGEDKRRIAQVQSSTDDMINGKANIRDREQVPEHYLEKIAGVHNSLYTAAENNVPMNLSQPVKRQSPVARVETLPVLQALRPFGDRCVDECRK